MEFADEPRKSGQAIWGRIADLNDMSCPPQDGDGLPRRRAVAFGEQYTERLRSIGHAAIIPASRRACPGRDAALLRRCFAEPGPYQTLHFITTPDRRCHVCPGRDAAFFMPLRRTGTVTGTAFITTPDQQRTTPKSGVLRSIRGTASYTRHLPCSGIHGQITRLPDSYRSPAGPYLRNGV